MGKHPALFNSEQFFEHSKQCSTNSPAQVVPPLASPPDPLRLLVVEPELPLVRRERPEQRIRTLVQRVSDLQPGWLTRKLQINILYKFSLWDGCVSHETGAVEQEHVLVLSRKAVVSEGPEGFEAEVSADEHLLGGGDPHEGGQSLLDHVHTEKAGRV